MKQASNRTSSNLYIDMFGQALGDALERAQLVAEEQTRQTYDNATTVWDGEIEGKPARIETYPTPKGFVLKLVVEGVCTRQMQTGKMTVADGTERVDIDSMTRGVKKLGVKTTGFAMFERMMEELAKVQTPPVSITRQSNDGTLAVFTVAGGMKPLSDRTVTIQIGAVTVSGRADSAAVKKAAAPFTDFVSML